jgi:predicted RNA-binding protein
MNHWIFCVTAHKDRGISDPREVIEQRFRDQFWGLGEKTPNRRALKAGDKIVFYLGIPHRRFAASAMLASDSFAVPALEQEQLSHGMEFYRAQYGVRLTEIKLWEHPCRVEDVLSALTFIENKENWGVYFQGGVRYLPEGDFEAITERALPLTLSNSLGAGDGSFVSRTEFALETHLEEFMDKNWNQIDFGRSLQRFVTEEENGRQFPAGQWSIDFLCKDTTNGHLVVIELKKGQTSDATVGQILRYMAWVDENMAESGQEVEGIIIAQDVDDALRYALKKVPSISVRTYRVDFALQKVN